VKRYLLDTNVISELRKTKPHGGVLAWTAGLTSEQMFLSSATFAELQTGVELTRKQDFNKAAEIEAWIDVLMGQLQVLPTDSVCFREWARLMQGTPTQLGVDAMLAATARVHGLIVATGNELDFRAFNLEIYNPFRTIRTT
jgi:toxin FitB